LLANIYFIKEVWKDHKNSRNLNNLVFQEKRLVKKYGDRTYTIPVKSIVKLNKNVDFVYDLCVPETQRFLCGDSILAHNTDSDVDGSHIRTLLLTFFFRQMPQLIMNGNIYIAHPPLYKMTLRGRVNYALDDNELEIFKKSLDEKSRKMIKVQRYKGLGEMNPEQLWETAMNPEVRSMSQVIINDLVKADEVFSILMGNQVEPRKEFITKHALNVRHLDV
jgi:DNA gyrase subunit B